MSDPPSILIIGAGLIGLSCADSLTKGGANVTVLDMRDGPARGTSYSNSGMIHPSQAAPWNMQDLSHFQSMTATRDVYDLAQTSKRLILERAQTLGLKNIGKNIGCLQLFQSQTARELKSEFYHSVGIPFISLPPNGGTFHRPALLFSDDISGNAFEYCSALEKNLRSNGVVFNYQSTRVQITHKPSGDIGIATASQNFTADHIIIAAGPSSASLLAPLGIDLKSYTEKGFAVDFEKPDCDLPNIPIMDFHSRSALTVFKDSLRLSGTTGQSDNTALLKIWKNIAPKLFNTLGDPIRVWNANRPMSTLGRPYIGQTAISGLWVNTGHGQMGWTLSAGSGALMADMILKKHQDQRFKLN